MTDKIFDVVYSLPTTSHSVALATRCLTDGRQRRYPTKYMPDFGGVQDIPNCVMKNNALSTGIPFNRQPINSLIRMPKNKETSETPGISECFVVSSYLKTISEDELVVIRALGNFLDFNLIKQTTKETICGADSPITYANIPYSNEITGIRYSKITPDFLLIKFDQEVKIIHLNNLFSVEAITEKQSVINVHACLTKNDGLVIKDACLNEYNLTMQAVVLDDCRNECCFELYDISNEVNTPLQTIKWDSGESIPITVRSKSAYVNNKMVGGSSLRTLVPASLFKGIQHIEKMPKHLINYIVTTGTRTLLIDPRCNEISLVLMDKSRLKSFYPIEYCKNSLFSTINEYQFYSLSNITVRALDIRYPGSPMNQINHMLDSSDYNYMNLKIIKNLEDSFETLCASSTDSICFLTFDQSHKKKFINPKSLHQPYHNTTPNQVTEAGMKCMHGLDVISGSCSEDLQYSFSVFQLNNKSDLFRRDFSFNKMEDDNNSLDSSYKIDVLFGLNSQSQENSDCLLRREEDKPPNATPKITKSRPSQTTRVLDILDEDEYQEENLPSHAALLRFELMMEKLRKT